MIELRVRQEEHQQRMWLEKIDAELAATHKRLELEKEARSTTAKLPKLTRTPFKARSTHWMRFKNMFVTQVQNKSISAGEIRLSVGNGQSKHMSKDSKPKAW